MSVKVSMGEDVLVYSPPVNEGTMKWGVYAIPRMWREKDGSLVIRFNGEKDSGDVDNMKIVPNKYFVSQDDGLSWIEVDDGDEKYDISILNGIENPYTKINGKLVAFREKPNRKEIKNITYQKEFIYPTGEAIVRSYRYGDIPDECKGIEIIEYNKCLEETLISDVNIDFPDREILINAKGNTGNFVYVDCVEKVKQSIFKNPYLCSVISVDNGTMLAVSCGQNRDVSDRYSGVAYLMASEDGGHTWVKRGVIAESTELPHGYTGDGHEVSMSYTKDGVLICAMRMDVSTKKEPYGTAVAISKDKGFTWSEPLIVTDASVTPHIICLENGIVVLVYGRPGVHFKYSIDNGETWSEDISIIGKTLSEYRKEGRDDYEIKYRDTVSYSNTFVDYKGGNEFLILYNNLKYDEGDGVHHKAAFVRKISIEKMEGN